MSGFSKTQWLLALGVAAFIHAGVAFFMLRSPPSSGSIAVGAGGMTVALSLAGRAPGAAEMSPPPVAPENVEALEELKEMTTTDRSPEAMIPEDSDDVPAPEKGEIIAPPAEEEQPKEPYMTTSETARTVEVPSAEAATESRSTTKVTLEQANDLDQIAEPEDDAASPSETGLSEDEAIDLADKVELDEAGEVAPSSTTISDAPNDVAPTSAETVVQAEQIAPEDVTARSPDPTAVTAPVLPPPRKPSASEAELTPEEQPEARSEPAELLGAGGEAGDQDEGDLGSGQNVSGSDAAGAKADYFAVLQAWLEQHKVYPRRALSRRLEGVVSLRFVMDREGQVLDYQVERSSGHRLLDRAVETLIEQAQPLPTMPDEIDDASLTLVVPISFVLN